MLDMGFLPSLRIILDKLPAKRHTMLFSATMGQSVAGLVASYLHNPVRIAVEACAQTNGRTDGRIDPPAWLRPRKACFGFISHGSCRNPNELHKFQARNRGPLPEMIRGLSITASVIESRISQLQ